MTRSLNLLALSLVLLCPATAAAQGLLWQLPPDGTAATYGGSYNQVLRRSGTDEQDVELTFNRELRVRSVGSQQVEFEGQTQPARWIELEQTTQPTGATQRGAGGSIIVKLLVPESFFDGQLVDSRGLPKSAIPVVRGYEQRDGGAVNEIAPGRYQPFPSVTLLRMPENLTEQSPGTWTATEEVESTTSRTEVQTRLVRDETTPFGIASWTVQTKDSAKQAANPRDTFVVRSETTGSMEFKSAEDGAVSAIDRE